MRRVLVAVGAIALFAVAIPTAAAQPKTSHGERCGLNDRPEQGIQGDVPLADQLSGRAREGYNCGVALVGHNSLGSRGGNANMAWSGKCAYVAGEGTGVAVVDVSDPARPKQTTTLHGPGSDVSIETIAAFTGSGRALLAAGRYGLVPTPLGGPVDFYDVSNCARPRFITTFTFPENVHNLTFAPDGRRLYATLPLQAADITQLPHVKFLGDLENEIPTSSNSGKSMDHEVTISPDGNTLYIGGQTPDNPDFRILDITGWPTRPIRVLSAVPGRGHSIRLATIKGRTYVLHSEESIVNPTAVGCASPDLNPLAGPSQPWLSDVTDPRHPVMRMSQFRLSINDPAHCATQAADGIDASVHYHDVDNSARTTFGMMSMWNAGLRIADLRDPRHPKEVAYFNPGMFRTTLGTALDQAWGHVRYLPVSGQMWFATASGGFWVVELEPQIRSELGLPAVPNAHPLGTQPRPTSASGEPLVAARPQTYLLYCTLGTLGAGALSR